MVRTKELCFDHAAFFPVKNWTFPAFLYRNGMPITASTVIVSDETYSASMRKPFNPISHFSASLAPFAEGAACSLHHNSTRLVPL